MTKQHSEFEQDPEIKENRPPYFVEVVVTGILTFLLGIASTYAYECLTGRQNVSQNHVTECKVIELATVKPFEMSYSGHASATFGAPSR